MHAKIHRSVYSLYNIARILSPFAFPIIKKRNLHWFIRHLHFQVRDRVTQKENDLPEGRQYVRSERQDCNAELFGFGFHFYQ